MAKQTKVTANLSALEGMLESLGGEYAVKVGLIGSGGSEIHDDSDATNAEIGLFQEFGTVNIPPRSFLRLPLETKQKELMKGISKGAAKEAIEEGDIKHFYEILGIEAVGIVQDAFSSGGFGEWPPNAPSTVSAKGSSKPLINTGQLRRSVSYEVVKKSELR